MPKLDLQRTIDAAHRLESAADAVTKVLTDTVANQREISAKLDATNTELEKKASQLEETLGKLNTGATVGAGELQSTVAALTQQLTEARDQLNQAGDAQSALDSLSNEMESKADQIAAAVVANTSADPARVQTGAAASGVGQAERIPGAGPNNLPPNTASNEGVQQNLGATDKSSVSQGGPAPGASGPMTGVPTSQTDASSQAEPQSAPPVPPANI